MSNAIFVGRKPQLELFENNLKKTIAGSGRTLLVHGVAGIGKTVLLRRFLAGISQSATARIVSIETRCLPIILDGSAYQPFVSVINHGEGQLRRLGKVVQEFLAEVAPDWLELIPVAGSMIKATTKTVGWVMKEAGASEDMMRAKMQEQFIRFITKMSTEVDALVLVMDDVQWLDQASAALWVEIVRAIKDRDLKVLLLCSYRDDLVLDQSVGDVGSFKFVHELALNENLVEEIGLDELGISAIEEYLKDRSGIAVIPTGILKWFMHASGGNPFFLSQLVEYAFEKQLMLVQDHSLHIANCEPSPKSERDMPGNWEKIPNNLEAVVRERTNHLSQELSQVVQFASVQGEEFYSVVLADCLDEDELKILRSLAQLSGVHHLVTSLNNDALKDLTEEYAFLHRITWQTIYAGLSSREKALLHKRIAESLEKRLTHMVHSDTEHLLTMANHWELAAEYTRAAEYYLQVCQRSVAAHSYTEAIQQREKGLQLLGRARGLDAHAKRLKLALLSQLAIQLIQAGKIDEEAILEMKLLAEQQGDRTALGDSYMKLYWFYNLKGDVHKGKESAQNAYEIRSRNEDKLGAAEALAGVCKMMARQGELAQVQPIYEKAVGLYLEGTKAGNADADSWVFYYLNRSYALAMSDLGHYSKAIQYLTASYTRAEKTQDGFQTVEALAHLTEEYLLIGQYEIAKTLAHKGLDVGKEFSIAKWQSLECSLHLGTLALLNHDYRAAVDIFGNGEKIALEGGSFGWWEIVYIKNSLGRIHLLDGTTSGIEEAGKIGVELSQIAEKEGFVHSNVQGLMIQALSAIRAGRLEHALRASDVAVDILEKQKYIVATSEEEILYLHSKVLAICGDLKPAQKYLQLSDDEVGRKLGFIERAEWRLSYQAAIRIQREFIDQMLTGSPERRPIKSPGGSL